MTIFLIVLLAVSNAGTALLCKYIYSKYLLDAWLYPPMWLHTAGIGYDVSLGIEFTDSEQIFKFKKVSDRQQRWTDKVHGGNRKSEFKLNGQ